MPYRGEQVHAPDRTDDGTNRLLVVLGVSSLLYPVARILLEVLWPLPDRTSELRLYRIVAYAIVALHVVPGLVSIALATKASTRDLRLLYAIGGAAIVIGMGVDVTPLETIALLRWQGLGANILVSGGLAAIAAGVARTRRASEDDDTGVLLSSVVALSAGSIVEIAWWTAEGYMYRSPYGWTSFDSYTSTRALEELHSKLTLLFFLVPLVLLGAGAIVRARARERAPMVDERAKEREAAEADALVLRFRASRNVLVAFALGTIAAVLPTCVFMLGLSVHNGRIGVVDVARALVFLQGMLATSIVMAFIASAGAVKNDAGSMRGSVLVASLFHLAAVVFLVGADVLGLRKLDVEFACGLWSIGAAGSVFVAAELARRLLFRGLMIGSSADELPDGLTQFVEQLSRLVRFVAAGAALTIGALFFANRSERESTMVPLAMLGSFASAGAIAGALVAASRARRVLDRVILWRLAGGR